MGFKSLFPLILLASSSLYAEIYKWTDDNGTVHFSDKSAPGAIKFDLNESKVVSSPKVSLENTSIDTSKVLKKKIEYKQIYFIEPKANETIRDAEGCFSVKIGLEPYLKNGDEIQLLVDGSPYEQIISSNNFTIKGLARGLHTLIARVINNKGVVVKSSHTIQVYMMPPKIGMVHKVN